MTALPFPRIRVRSLRLHVSTYAVAIASAIFFAVLNIPGNRVFEPGLEGNGKYGPHFEPDTWIHHGWPTTYLQWDGPTAWWSALPPEPVEFSYSALAFDLLLASALTLAAAFVWELRRRRRNRILQVTLHDLFLLLFLQCTVLAWIAINVLDYRREQAFLSSLSNGNVSAEMQLGGPTWARELLGDGLFKFFDRVMYLTISSDQLDRAAVCRDVQVLCLMGVEPQDLRHLRLFEKLRAVDACMSDFDDAGLARLAGSATIGGLNLYDTSVTSRGIASLVHLPNLVNLDLSRTEVDDLAAKHLSRLTKLQSLSLSGTRVSDLTLAQLKSLTQLQHLDLGTTRVSPEGVAKLRHQLPKCEIYYSFPARYSRWPT